MWPTIALMAAGALSNMSKQKNEADNMRRHNLAQAEITKYSPWTGLKGSINPAYQGSPLEAGMGGAIQGANVAQGLNLGFGKPEVPGSESILQKPGLLMGSAQGPNQMGYLGAGDMQFGQSNIWDDLAKQQGQRYGLIGR